MTDKEKRFKELFDKIKSESVEGRDSIVLKIKDEFFLLKEKEKINYYIDEESQLIDFSESVSFLLLELSVCSGLINLVIDSSLVPSINLIPIPLNILGQTEILIDEEKEISFTFDPAPGRYINPALGKSKMKLTSRGKENCFLEIESQNNTSNNSEEKISLKTSSSNGGRFTIEFEKNFSNLFCITRAKNIHLLLKRKSAIIGYLEGKGEGEFDNFKYEGEAYLSFTDLVLKNSFFKDLKISPLNSTHSSVSVNNCKIKKLSLELISNKIHFLDCVFSDVPEIIIPPAEKRPSNMSFSFFKSKFELKNKSMEQLQTASDYFRDISEFCKYRGNDTEALRFKAYEMKYRPKESRLEWLNYKFYELLNDCGLSFGRPLLWLFALFIFFGLIFWFCFDVDCYDSFKISLNNTLVIRWIVPKGFVPESIDFSDGIVYLGLVQSLFSSILLYLFIIGVRLRFRIRT